MIQNIASHHKIVFAMCTKEQTCNVSAPFFLALERIEKLPCAWCISAATSYPQKSAGFVFITFSYAQQLVRPRHCVSGGGPSRDFESVLGGVEHVTSEALSNASFVSVSIGLTRATRSQDVATELPCLWKQKDYIITRPTILHCVLSAATYNRGGS